MSSSELVMVAGENFCNDELSSTAAGMGKDYLKDKEEEELELGLCLGGKKKVVVKPYDTGSVDYCRILTAEDFSSPSSMVRAQFPSNRPRPPYSSCSSSSGSSSSSLLMVVGVRGSSKNTAVDDDSTVSVAVTAKQLVGWPPVRTYRKNSFVNQTSKRTNSSSSENNPDAIQHKKPFVGSQARTHRNIIEEAIFHGRKKVILHLVKVNMDGDPIGRKVDLNSYSSYTTLCIALEDMFQKISEPRRTSARVTNASKLLDGSSEFVLTYEDKDEDWMLVGDVPWRMFLTTVRKLRIMRRSEANVIYFLPVIGHLPPTKHSRDLQSN